MPVKLCGLCQCSWIQLKKWKQRIYVYFFVMAGCSRHNLKYAVKCRNNTGSPTESGAFLYFRMIHSWVLISKTTFFWKQSGTKTGLKESKNNLEKCCIRFLKNYKKVWLCGIKIWRIQDFCTELYTLFMPSKQVSCFWYMGIRPPGVSCDAYSEGSGELRVKVNWLSIWRRPVCLVNMMHAKLTMTWMSSPNAIQFIHSHSHLNVFYSLR